METTKQLIEEFIKSTDEELNLPMIPTDNIDDIMQELGFLDQDDYETNGWQCDFWKSYSNDSCNIGFNGSLYYGQFKLIKNDKRILWR